MSPNMYNPCPRSVLPQDLEVALICVKWFFARKAGKKTTLNVFPALTLGAPGGVRGCNGVGKTDGRCNQPLLGQPQPRKINFPLP